MSTATHTPGPWGIGVSCDRTPAVTVPEEQGSGFVVAHINRIPLMKGVRGNADANARLIAAAPDMLAALKMLREIDDAYGFDLNEQQRDQMHDAIAKAEGRS